MSARKANPVAKKSKPATERTIQPWKIQGQLVALVTDKDGKPVGEHVVGTLELYASEFGEIERIVAEQWPQAEAAFAQATDPAAEKPG